MRVIETTVFFFDELSEPAKEKAREWYRNALGGDFAWTDESKNSVVTFCNEFGASLTSWCVGPYSPIEYATDAENNNFRGRKLREFNRDNMPTGYCLDCDLWMTFYDEFKRTGSAKRAFDSALEQGFEEWRSDMESQLEDAQIDDSLRANEYEFAENGKRV